MTLSLDEMTSSLTPLTSLPKTRAIFFESKYDILSRNVDLLACSTLIFCTSFLNDQYILNYLCNIPTQQILLLQNLIFLISLFRHGAYATE